MNDLISRQAAIDAIIDELKRSPTPAIRAKFRLEALPSAQPEQKKDDWIPVSERMPELDEDGYSEKVLVCFDRASFCEICEYRTDKWYIGDMEDSPEDFGLRVTAWMPLPAPYRGGEMT